MFEWCIGQQQEACDLHPMTSSHSSSYIHVFLPDLPSNLTMFLTVVATNNIDMTCKAASLGFRFDTTHPVVAEGLELLGNPIVLPECYALYEGSHIGLSWYFVDDDSPIVSHEIDFKAHYAGKIQSKHWKFGNLNLTRIKFSQGHELVDGELFDLVVTSCNAAGLCTSNSTVRPVLIDSSPPHVGSLADPLYWTFLNGSFVVNATFRGFADPHSSIVKYCLAMGTTFRQWDITEKEVCSMGRFLSEDVTVSVKIGPDLRRVGNLYISYWAVNGVGLTSMLREAYVDVVKGNPQNTIGTLNIYNHSCSSETCNTDCTCTVVGNKCSHGDDSYRKTKCHDIKNSTDSDMVIVHDGDYPDDIDLTSSTNCLSGWFEVDGNQSAVRFEVSLGRKGRSPGQGIFDVQTEPAWYDIGLEQKIVHCLTAPRQLANNEEYVVHVRAWWSENEYKVYQSDGVLVDQTSPIISSTGDITCQSNVSNTDDNIIHAGVNCSWDTVFFDHESGLHHYEITVQEYPSGKVDFLLIYFNYTTNYYSSRKIKVHY